MTIFVVCFTVIFSYLFGSLNSAIVVCKILKGQDIREYGSKNAGLTNVLRVYGKGPAAVTLILDLVKGIVAVMICWLVAYFCDVELFADPLFVKYLAAVFVMLGHVFPLYYGFKGGKGVLLTCTTLMAIDPLTCALALSVFIILVAITRYVSVGSIFGAIAYPVFTWITQSMRDYENFVINGMCALLICIIIIFKHRANIVRLFNGTESKLSFKKKDSSDEG